MKKLVLLIVSLAFTTISLAAGTDPFIFKKYTPGSFSIANSGMVSSILVSRNDWPGVTRAARDLQNDLHKVTGINPVFSTDKATGITIIIGTIGKNTIVDELIRNNKINVAGIAGNWESTLIEVVKNPVPGVDSALVIAGSDKRGTIYGIYELCSQIGVSPWYYWADVPVQRSNSLFAISGRHIISSPAVKYRGIFLNDEAPALSGWSRKEFGGFNSKFYAKVFELILRLKGNYLWPAMWGSAFNDDDKMNPVLADEYGVVIGTSHHEPLTRAHDEWKRYQGGKWNYDQNPAQLREFWESGLKRVADKEQLITVGMRGDGDEPMTEGTATALLEKIVKDQRDIIEKVTRKPASETPQLWALYKEVQAYYDKGMRVPDDITLLLCDDNWGNIRKLPKLNEAPRKGGYGIYYHFDYVGDPRNYKWINTNPIQKVWEQMNLAYEYNANQIWIVNVGDLKPMEFPISFFLDYAWAPDAIPSEKLKQYTIDWSAKQFGETYSAEIADILDFYSKYNGRIKPELLTDSIYSLNNYNEFENVVSDYKRLEQKAKFIYGQISADQKDAYYQLVMHPVEASANLYDLYYHVARNKLYAKQGRSATNDMSEKVAELYKRDEEISNYYNKIMAGGKWDHMMDQTHIGYTNWQQPEKNSIPNTMVLTSTGDLSKAESGLAIEGSDAYWSKNQKVNIALPTFNYSNHQHYIELFNKAKGSFSYQIKAPSYILVQEPKGEITTEKRILLSIDWAKAPKGKSQNNITVSTSDGTKLNVPIYLDHTLSADQKFVGFIAQNGYISMEAPNYTRAVNSRPIFWKTLANYGKTLGGMITVPVTSAIQKVDISTPRLEYDIYLDQTGTFTLNSFISPTIDFTNSEGLKFAISIDDDVPVVVNISADYKTETAWRKSVADNIKIFKTPVTISKPGSHTIKYWMVTPAVVLQKMVLDLGGLKPSFLGPPETFRSEIN
ncbi:glycosyl hydrolase 115 family protein [Pedobacter sp. MC2016-05]|uniref:glycosyl hydrolase 115 family protein n=1 Tax=Pedobacter sp. MC2016-05 TaxID=2994474 RepID=UPI00224693C0|nr:glycosyl hydrolase 115 family protein [Pedobacter sp. MC2016-05]MCX2473036.1 glycosyl hydrolase 115 family protein [Pedobacter sp. MC2016-05]